MKTTRRSFIGRVGAVFAAPFAPLVVAPLTQKVREFDICGGRRLATVNSKDLRFVAEWLGCPMKKTMMDGFYGKPKVDGVPIDPTDEGSLAIYERDMNDEEIKQWVIDNRPNTANYYFEERLADLGVDI